MSRYHVRCRECQARRVLAQHPEHYLRPPRCACGAKRWRYDRWMNNRNTSPYYGGMGCTCNGYWFTHRKGGGSCFYNQGTDDD